MSKLIDDRKHYQVFKFIFGGYVASVFSYFAFFALEVIPFGGANPTAPDFFPFNLFPNILSMTNNYYIVFSIYLLAVVLSILFIFEVQKTLVCILLWYLWACTFNRFNLLISPGCVTVGWLLLLNAGIPKTEKDKAWQIPRFAMFATWIFMFFLYVPSGIHKLFSPSWIEGKAIFHMMNFPMAKLNQLRDLIINNLQIAKVANDYAIYSEILFGFLLFSSKRRFIAWLITLILHIGILTVVHFEFITIGVLMAHVFTFDWKWVSHEKTT